MTNTLDRVLDRFKLIAEGQPVPIPAAKFDSYAVSNFRGGIGKTTLGFNLAWELSRSHRLLLLDMCPQRSFSELLLGEELQDAEVTIYDALLPKVLPGADGPDADSLVYNVRITCPSFKGNRPTFMIAGSSSLFLFPSNLYNAINQVASLGDPRRIRQGTDKTLSALSDVIKSVKSVAQPTRTLIDTSPFFAGGTHLAWAAVDALIIPVRVDQQSIDALKLTLEMLRNPSMDFLRINRLAGRTEVPKVHAVAMTHCGWARQQALTPDRSTQTFVSKVLDIVGEYADLFSSADITECIYLLDDFHSAGRISGAKRIPLAKLTVGQFVTIERQRLEVNESLTRYQREVKALASIL